MPNRRYPVRKAPPKPSVEPCAYCTGAYWRYNGTSWYVCDLTTKKRHFCLAPAAVEARVRSERQPPSPPRASPTSMRRRRAVARVFKPAAWAVGIALVILSAGTSPSTSTSYEGPGAGGDYGSGGSAYIGGGSGGSGGAYGQPSGGNSASAPGSTPTAICADGSVSYAANHQGACSWHGGVSSWTDQSASGASLPSSDTTPAAHVLARPASPPKIVHIPSKPLKPPSRAHTIHGSYVGTILVCDTGYHIVGNRCLPD